MDTNKYLISILDLLLIVSAVLFMALFSITNEDDKGVGDLDHNEITPFQESLDVEGSLDSFDFYAFVLSDSHMEIVRFSNGKGTSIAIANSVDELTQVLQFNQKLDYVIYERETNPYFPKLVRFLSRKGISFGIARVANEF